MLTDNDDDLDAIQAVRQFAEDDEAAVGYAAAQLACVIEGNSPSLDTERIEILAD